MTIRGWLAMGLAAVLASPAALPAQQSPEEVAAAYFAHFRAGEMNRAVALMHPRALESFRTVMLGMIGEDELEETPLAGRDDIATMPADSFYLAFFQGVGEDDDFTAMFRTLNVQPLGHVLQGDSLAHVVYSAGMDFMNQQTQQTAVLTVRRHRGGWLVDPGDGLASMVGGGLISLIMAAGMQAGMAAGFGGMDYFNVGVDVDHDSDDDDDEDHDHDEDDEDDDDDEDDEDEDEDSDDPPSR